MSLETSLYSLLLDGRPHDIKIIERDLYKFWYTIQLRTGEQENGYPFNWFGIELQLNHCYRIIKIKMVDAENDPRFEIIKQLGTKEK